MGSSNESSKRHEDVGRWVRRTPLTPQLACVAFGVGALALTSCGSDTSEDGATANGDDDTAAEQLDDASSDQLADARADLEELQESGGLGSGGGVVTIEGVDYSFDAAICYSGASGFEAAGPGQTADGVPYWATLSTAVSTREEMLEAGLPEESIDAFFGDKDSIEGFGLQIELGKVDQFTDGDDSLAQYRIDVIDISSPGDLTYTVDGNTLSGSGSVVDDNGVALEYNEPAPATFSATCD